MEKYLEERSSKVRSRGTVNIFKTITRILEYSKAIFLKERVYLSETIKISSKVSSSKENQVEKLGRK